MCLGHFSVKVISSTMVQKNFSKKKIFFSKIFFFVFSTNWAISDVFQKIFFLAFFGGENFFWRYFGFFGVFWRFWRFSGIFWRFLGQNLFNTSNNWSIYVQNCIHATQYKVCVVYSVVHINIFVHRLANCSRC